MNFSEKTIKENLLYRGKVLDFYVDDVLLPNGKTAKREIVKHSGGSAVLLEKDGKVLLVKQFRYAYKKEIYEIPAGKINKSEQPIETARRELEEECGYRADDLTLLFTMYPSTGYTNEIIYIYKAVNPIKTQINLDEDEFLSSKWFEVKELKKMIKSGEICDGKTLLALSTIINYKEETEN